jgi:Zn-dependent alcohol dehydrogenase
LKAFILDRYGSADRVRAGDMPDPEPREDEALVRIHAAGVNPLDSRIRNGEFKSFLRYHVPIILGHDVAGVVVRVGSRVRRFKPGDGWRRRCSDSRQPCYSRPRFPGDRLASAGAMKRATGETHEVHPHHFHNADQIRGVTYDGRHVWAAAGSKLLAIDHEEQERMPLVHRRTVVGVADCPELGRSPVCRRRSA